MGSHRRSFFTEPNPSTTTTKGTSSNHAVSKVVEEENPMAQMWRTPSLKEFHFKDLKFGMAVAIKVLNPSTSLQGFQEWQSEVNFLGRHYHPNIISLFGYCWEDEKLVVVYEFMLRGSLENHLFPKTAISLRIYGSKLPLELVENYNAKLSDFGLVMRWPSCEESPISTDIIGTYGYFAPEYVATGSYILGQLRNIDIGFFRAYDMNRSRKQQNLVDWLKPMLSQRKKLKTIIDVHMKGKYSAEAAFQAAELSLKCLESDPRSRPSMKEVMEVLKEIEALKDKTK
ncbi:hypothetical protein Dsin_011516 [Dipteronia sinensis]|uniref:Protein kinase domain-containing protein n=1 Tax=Dipteronia sinensis TaxID=43782 RepID=A0AAE0AUE8_9ROSI|nr:hypothetical protein Dsin_011516 [Dipteronia sinensis]